MFIAIVHDIRHNIRKLSSYIWLCGLTRYWTLASWKHKYEVVNGSNTIITCQIFLTTIVKPLTFLIIQNFINQFIFIYNEYNTTQYKLI